MSSSEETNSLLSQFTFTNLLNTDSGGRRIILQGTIQSKPALLLAERGAFSTDSSYLSSFSNLISKIQNLGDNDIYRWYLATEEADLKINLIWPCTEKHVRKYSFQQMRLVVETGEIYSRYVKPYIKGVREEGREDWVFNILEGKAEQENILYRSEASNPEDDFLLLPDLNWDRKTTSSLHLLALPIRRDIWSVRDLRKEHVPWLRHLRFTLAATATNLYPGVEEDMLKFYVHYQPTYYHFHVHIVHINLDATGTQAVGKALGLDHIISQLEHLEGGGMEDVGLTYTVGESSELWERIWGPLKEGREPNVSGAKG